MAFADNKRFVIERVLAKAEVVRDEAFVKVASLEFECKHLAWSVVDSANEMLGRALSNKEALHPSWPCEGKIGRCEEGTDVGTEAKGCSSTSFNKGKDVSG